MENANIRKKENFFAEFFHSSAQVRVLIVEEESLVESVYAKEKRARDGEGGATYPCNSLRRFRFPERSASGESGMISKEVEEGDIGADAPRLGHFRLKEEFETGDAERGISFESL